MAKNEVYITTDLNDETLWRRDVQLGSVHWINQAPAAGSILFACVTGRTYPAEIELM